MEEFYMYNDVRLEKGMYNLSGKSFTAALEELDPSAASEMLGIYWKSFRSHMIP